MTCKPIKYINLKEALNIAKQLERNYDFNEEMTNDLTGLGCALAISEIYDISTFGFKQILMVCGAGMNGLQGLYCAKHLKLFGYYTVIYLNKRIKKAQHCRLLYQLKMLCVPILDCLPRRRELECNYKLIVDALFGISYQCPLRREYEHVFRLLKDCTVPIASIDVPSGYDLKNENDKEAIRPETLLSVGAPKICAKKFCGKHHFLVGRFIPKKVQDCFKLNLPCFPPGKYAVCLPVPKPCPPCPCPRPDEDGDCETSSCSYSDYIN